jgi:membrane protein
VQLSKELPRIINRIKRFVEDLLEKRWVRFMLHLGRQLGDDNAGDMAASISYFSILSIFPLLLGILALLGLFFPSEMVWREIFTFFGRNLPGAAGLLEDNIRAIIHLRGALGLVSIVGLIWSGSIIFGAISRAVNRAWGIKQYRPYYQRKFRDLVLALSTSVLVFFSLGVSALTVILPNIDYPILVEVPGLVGQLLAASLIFMAFLLLYKFMPNVRVPWHDSWIGALAATFLFEIGRLAFIFYLSHFGHYDLVYGSLASLIVFIVWIYFSSYIFIIGAEFNSLLFRTRGTPAR